MSEPILDHSSLYWRVYSYLSLRWYECEYGRIEQSAQSYGNAMRLMEDIAFNWSAKERSKLMETI